MKIVPAKCIKIVLNIRLYTCINRSIKNIVHLRIKIVKIVPIKNKINVRIKIAERKRKK